MTPPSAGDDDARPAATAADLSALGIAVGHATDPEGATGLTVVRGVRGPMRAAAAVVGRATGTRDMQPLDPRHLVDRVDAVLLTGGSAYGLDAAAGVMRWMEERGRGFPVGADGVVPIVPAAVVFDLAPLGRFDARPTAAMAYEACEGARSAPIAEGSVGAGAGTTVGKGAGVEHAMKGGVGVALAGDGDTAVGAVAVVNAFGDVRDAEGRILAGARAAGGHFLDSAALVAGGRGRERFADAAAMRNTTLAVVATSAPLSRLELAQVAQAATAAFYRRITPAGTSFDGDVVFAVAALESGDGTGRSPGSAFGTGGPLRSAQGRLPHRDVRSGDDSTHHPSPAALPQSPLTAADLMRFEQLAVRALEDAIERAVRCARGRDGIPGLADSAAS